EPVTLELLVERGDGDAERARSVGLVTPRLLERLLDGHALDMVQADAREGQALERAVAPHRDEAHVVRLEQVAVEEGERAAQGILELPDVARPRVPGHDAEGLVADTDVGVSEV